VPSKTEVIHDYRYVVSHMDGVAAVVVPAMTKQLAANESQGAWSSLRPWAGWRE
jgi:hypothetical protein